jgi:hypothetical protein
VSSGLIKSQVTLTPTQLRHQQASFSSSLCLPNYFVMISKDAAAIPDILISTPSPLITTSLWPQQTETAHHEGLATPTKPHFDTDSDFRHQSDYIRYLPQLGLDFEKPCIMPTTPRIGGTMATQSQNHSPNCLFHTSARKPRMILCVRRCPRTFLYAA